MSGCASGWAKSPNWLLKAWKKLRFSGVKDLRRCARRQLSRKFMNCLVEISCLLFSVAENRYLKVRCSFYPFVFARDWDETGAVQDKGIRAAEIGHCARRCGVRCGGTGSRGSSFRGRSGGVVAQREQYPRGHQTRCAGNKRNRCPDYAWAKFCTRSGKFVSA